MGLTKRTAYAYEDRINRECILCKNQQYYFIYHDIIVSLGYLFKPKCTYKY